MSDIRYCTHDFLKEFINIYKSFPCLWKVKSREYNDRIKKNKAYEFLVEKYKEVDSSATRETVTKKINSLRSTYRKEVMKVLRSEKTKVKYRPTLWYYNMLDFLTDQDLQKESKNTLDDSNTSNTESNWNTLENEEIGRKKSSELGRFFSPKEFAKRKDPRLEECSEPIMETDRIDEESSTIMGQSNHSSEYEYTRGYTTLSAVSKGTKRSASEEALSNSKVIQLVAEKLRRTDDTKTDRNVSFGKYVADELNNMSCEMVPYVKKIINLAIFEGNMKTLNAASSINTYGNRQSHGLCASGETSSSNNLASGQIKQL